MPRPRFTYALLLALSGLWACKEDKVIPTADVKQRVFTNGAEITDTKTSSRFIQQSATPFTVPAGSPGPTDIVRFVAPDTVTFGTNSMRFSVTKNGTQHLFYSPALVRVATPNDPLRTMLKYTAPLVAVPTSSGFSYVTKEVRVGYSDQNSLRLSLLHYRLRHATPGGGASDASGILFNEFNNAVVASLRVGDTLAVQESSLTLPVQ